jgi:hypothetical protein
MRGPAAGEGTLDPGDRLRRRAVPLLNIFWTSAMVAGFVLGVWLLFVVLRDVFDRDDLSAGARVGWTALAILVPLLGSLIYLVSRSHDAGELRLWGGTSRRREAEMYR